MKKTFAPLLSLVLIILAAPVDARSNRPESVAGVFDYYLLALSWSPTFCLTQPGNEQCSGKGYGFVLHGLWPQYSRGGWPQFCGQEQGLTPAQRAQGRMLFVTDTLLEHEWKKHGTCTGLGAEGYFATSDRALAAVVIPPELEASPTTQRFAAAQIVDLFQRSNPQLPAEAIAVRCRGPELSEVWVCLSKDLGFAECGKDVRSQCKAGSVRVPALR